MPNEDRIIWILSILSFVVFICVYVIYIEQIQNNDRDDLPFLPQHILNLNQQNRMFNGYENVDFVCISMQHRKSVHFQRLYKQLITEGVQLTWFEGIDGKKLNPSDYNLAKRYKQFFENNYQEYLAGKTKHDYRGHLGCTISHLNVIAGIQNMTVIFEDDAEIVPHFRQKFQSALAAVTKIDPNWEVLLLGWCCNYKDHGLCKLNDCEPVLEGGIVKVHYWFGGWAYCIRGHKEAEKILGIFNPISWHIDLSLAEAAQSNKLRVYACMPTIANHAGHLRISSFDFVQKGDSKYVKTDTNA